MLKSLLVNKDFQTWHLIGWQLCIQAPGCLLVLVIQGGRISSANYECRLNCLRIPLPPCIENSHANNTEIPSQICNGKAIEMTILNSHRCSDRYTHQWIISSLVKVFLCKLLCELMLTKFRSSQSITKCYAENGDHVSLVLSQRLR